MSFGYAWLREWTGNRVLPVPSAVAGRRRAISERSDGGLDIPPGVGPQSENPIEHIQFALKHEGTNLAVLREALEKIDGADVRALLCSAPNSKYGRLVGGLWEVFNQSVLDDLPRRGGEPVDVFDPEDYVVGPSVPLRGWRVTWNGLGTPTHCPTVRLTESIRSWHKRDVLGQAKAMFSTIPINVLDRAINWLYLHETESSFRIERAALDEGKRQRFAALLLSAHDGRPLSEDYLCELQNLIVSNPLEQAASFRFEQNSLMMNRGGIPIVTYVPPPPDLAREIAESIMASCNAAHDAGDPIVCAAIASFAFVFAHPFMDGNGRVSRFMFHKALCLSGAIDDGLILPMSVAMAANERAYLAALQSFSRPARDLWSVRVADIGQYDFEFRGSASAYRYWDATEAVEFSFRMADEALNQHVRREVDFLAHHDAIVSAVSGRLDVRGQLLSDLVVMCLENDLRVSKRRRDQYRGRVPEEAFDLIEAEAERLIGGASPRAAPPTRQMIRPR